MSIIGGHFKIIMWTLSLLFRRTSILHFTINSVMLAFEIGKSKNLCIDKKGNRRVEEYENDFFDMA